MSNNPILITGAAGFIGFHTATRLLQAGRTVVGVDNLNDYYDPELKKARLQQLENFAEFSFVQADIADKTAMEKTWVEQGPFLEVIHLAAQAGVRYSLENPYSYVTSNCMGHVTIMEMCRHTEDFKHLVYASSSSVYGGNEKLPYAVEDSVDKPISLYAATKRADELMSHTYSHLFDLPQTGLRFFTVYGPWGRPDMALFIFTKNICEGRPIPVFNNGDMQRDFTYIDDIVSGLIGALEHPPEREGKDAPWRVLNIGNNRSEKLTDFIELIKSELDKKAEIDFLPMQPGDVPATYADINAIQKLTGYAPTTTIREGIPRFINWYKEFYGVKD